MEQPQLADVVRHRAGEVVRAAREDARLELVLVGAHVLHALGPLSGVGALQVTLEVQALDATVEEGLVDRCAAHGGDVSSGSAR